MKTNRINRLAILLLATTFGLAGCQSSPPDSSPSNNAPTGRSYDGYYRTRNPYFLPKPILALDSTEMNRLASTADAGERWYDDRNDWQRTITAGFATSTVESTYTQTYDHIYQHGGNVRTHFSQWTRRGSYKETVR